MKKRWCSVYFEPNGKTGGEWWALDNNGGDCFQIIKAHNGRYKSRFPDNSEREVEVEVTQVDGQDDHMTLKLSVFGQAVYVEAEDLNEGFQLLIHDIPQHFVLFRREVHYQAVVVPKSEDCQSPEEAVALLIYGETDATDIGKPYYIGPMSNCEYSDEYASDYLFSPATMSVNPSVIPKIMEFGSNMYKNKITMAQVQSAWDEICKRRDEKNGEK